ncbi:complement factor H-related protein 1-like [Nelusetta ayraudi]|uniref:complement factor H-related protein 1-like n=1 Tax=Nelusetta ayraudi TaxID=303726 RepID=UPI003F7098A8
MYQMYLGFLLLVWLPAVLRAKPAAQRCHAPLLSGGFFVPGNEFFSHGAKVTYSCNHGQKPVSGGWWATSTCQDGQWSDRPQCIDENACLPLTVPNANYAQNARTWYANGYTLRMKCNEGYKFINNDATAKCSNGAWTSLPVCQRDEYSCGEPPQVPHAVIIDQEYRELFAVDSQVTYQCEDGYTLQGGSNNMSIGCHHGNWTTSSSCSEWGT